MTLTDLLAQYSPGSGNHDWPAEFADLWGREPGYMLFLMTSVIGHGVLEPVVVGDDGRLWDGHHRVAIAVALGHTDIEVEKGYRS